MKMSENSVKQKLHTHSDAGKEILSRGTHTQKKIMDEKDEVMKLCEDIKNDVAHLQEGRFPPSSMTSQLPFSTSCI